VQKRFGVQKRVGCHFFYPQFLIEKPNFLLSLLLNIPLRQRVNFDEG
jgi:hypothetical protein